MNKEDFIFQSDNDGNLMTGGYKINSKLFKKQMAMKNVNIMKDENNIEKVSDIFNNLAVPAGLLVLTDDVTSSCFNTNYEGPIESNLYDKLLSLVSNDNLIKNFNKRYTKKLKHKYSKKTRRNRT